MSDDIAADLVPAIQDALRQRVPQFPIELNGDGDIVLPLEHDGDETKPRTARILCLILRVHDGLMELVVSDQTFGCGEDYETDYKFDLSEEGLLDRIIQAHRTLGAEYFDIGNR